MEDCLLCREKISEWRAQRIAQDEELREVGQVGVVQIPAKKKGKKARVTMASDRSWKR